MRRNKSILLPALVLGAILLASVLAPLLAPYDPGAIDVTAALQPPGSPGHLLGTDALGRDMLSRLLYGGRGAILPALAATVLSMAFGLVVGVLGGYFGGWLDWGLTVLTNIFQGLPGTCLMVAVAGVLGPGAEHLVLALVLTSWAGFSRVVRTETIRVREAPFVENLRALGAGPVRLLCCHVVPNLLPNLVVLFTTRLGRGVLSVAALSFLGLGLPPPAPDWSVMINDARLHYRSAPYLLIEPGVCILLLLLSLNLLGDALRDRLDGASEEVSLD